MFNDLYIKQIRLEKPQNMESSYVLSLPAFKGLDSLQFDKKVTFIVGENGTGKSTLLEAIAVNYGFNPEGGTRNFSFSSHDTHSDLFNFIRIVKGVHRPKDGFFLRAESFYNVASEIERLNELDLAHPLFSSYGGKSLHNQSHGESFMSLVLNRFGGNGIYILDEPEAALSPSRQMTLLAQINSLVKKQSQFIIATHSPILLAYPDADIYVLNDDGIVLTRYEDTEHYMLTKQFLDNPERMIKYLFE
jgi:predicted ATPase